MARFVFNSGAPLEIHDISEEQKQLILDTVKKKDIFHFEHEDKLVWANFQNLEYFYIIPKQQKVEEVAPTPE